MLVPVKYLDFYRNIKGRYDLMRFLYKWDTDYRRDLIVTSLAFGLFGYSGATWNSAYDLMAMVIEGSIILVQLGGEMSILPADYRPSQGGVVYTAHNSTHIAYDELSFLMSGVYPAPEEEPFGFHNPVAGWGVCNESPLVSDAVDDTLMTRKNMPYQEKEIETNYIRSRHQLRYIAIRVANKLQHTTNGVLLALYDMADTIMSDRPLIVKKSFYFDALMTVEAFRSRIFRNNLHGKKEVFTDLTTYFPVKKEVVNGHDCVRFTSNFYKQVSGHIGITTLLLTENHRVAMLFQGSTKAVGAHMVCLGGSGSLSYSDLEMSGRPQDFREVLNYSLSRELCEETGMGKYFDEVRKNTLVTGFFRWIDRCGLPEFIGITRAGSVPFSKERAIDGDEVIKYEEIPITVDTLDDFHKVLAYVREHKVHVALSSLMALHRMTVIAGYNTPGKTDKQKRIHQITSEFLFEKGH